MALSPRCDNAQDKFPLLITSNFASPDIGISREEILLQSSDYRRCIHVIAKSGLVPYNEIRSRATARRGVSKLALVFAARPSRDTLRRCRGLQRLALARAVEGRRVYGERGARPEEILSEVTHERSRAGGRGLSHCRALIPFGFIVRTE